MRTHCVLAYSADPDERPHDASSNGWHYGLKIFKPEKNLEFFRLKF